MYLEPQNQYPMIRYLVTGANAGIGYATALALAKLPDTELIIVCRNAEKGQAARQSLIEAAGHERVHLYLADLSSLAAIHQLGTKLRQDFDSLDVLVNNAGAYFENRETSAEGFEMTLALNHLNYFVLTHYLLDLLKARPKARIVNVSSEAHRVVRSIPWDDLNAERRYGGLAAYGLSKFFNILFTKELARHFKKDGIDITVNCLHPGVVATNIFSANAGFFTRLLYKIGKVFMRNQDDGASTSVYLASSPEVEGISGEYFMDCKQRRSSALSCDEEAAAKLWMESMQMAGLEAYGKLD